MAVCAKIRAIPGESGGIPRSHLQIVPETFWRKIERQQTVNPPDAAGYGERIVKQIALQLCLAD